MRVLPLIPLLLVFPFASCAKESTTVTTSSETTTTVTQSSMAEKAGDAGLRARRKAEALKREADAKAKAADATNE